jgi:PhnB protein
MMLNPYLNFDGDCAEAFRFYAECLHGQILSLQTFAQSPMADQAPPESRDRVIHARLQVGDKLLMGSDGMVGAHRKPQGMTVAIGFDTPAEAERVFGALSEGGQVTMPIQETFWAERFGMVVDRFGIPWMVNCEKPGAV